MKPAFHPIRQRRAFTLIETAAVIAATSVLGIVGVAGVAGARRADAHTNCSARLANIGAGNGQFALANQDLMFGLTWQRNGANSQYPDLNALQAGSQNGAHAAQAIDILRRRGRPDVPVIQGWIADPLYSHLVLVDFLNRPLSDPFTVCPSDDNLNKWRRWPAAFEQGRFLPNQPNPGSVGIERWPYSSSYSPTAGAFDVNQSVLTPQAPQARLTQNGNAHNLYSIPSASNIGPSTMGTVAFPAQKVHFFDNDQRHLPGKPVYFMDPQATLPILFFDGSVRVKTSQDARGSWIPQFPTSPLRTTVLYTPSAWESPTTNGQGFQQLADPYRWTREGLLGWDFQN